MSIYYFLFGESSSQTTSPLIALLLAVVVAQSSCVSKIEPPKLNHFQMIGSHNSYKQAIQPELLKVAMAQDPSIAGLAYSHLTIPEQLDMGLRIIEIDIYNDPEGGRYSQPLGNQIISSMGLPVQDFDPSNDLEKPGFKVFHVQDIDFRSHCLLLKNCLSEIKHWSESHPDHFPIVITINVKADTLQLAGSTEPLPFTAEVYDQLDDAFLQSLGRDNIITPEAVQAEHSSLNEAILSAGWPDMDDCRGKFLLVLDEPMKKIDTYHGPDRAERGILFTNAPAGHPESAFIVSNHPRRDQALIQQYVKDGYLVRTRADADTKEAVTLDYTRFEAAKSSGAQYISTDYYYQTLEHPKFKIQFEDGSYARCNPLLAAEDCSLNSK